MPYRLLLATLFCTLTASCSADIKHEFEKNILTLDRFFSEKPVIVTSNIIVKDGEENYAYYTLKMVDCDISNNIIRTFSKDRSYFAFVNITCNAFDNAEHGDLVYDASEFQTELGLPYIKAGGFSTTHMALANTDFSTQRKCTITIRYSYLDNFWLYNSIDAGNLSKSFSHDLKNFPQNKKFREAIGMVN